MRPASPRTCGTERGRRARRWTLLAGALCGLLAGGLGADEPVVFGVYGGGSLYDANPARGASALATMDNYIQLTEPDRGVSLGGDFISMEDGAVNFNLHASFDAGWDAGYTPFVNVFFSTVMSPPRTAAYIASGAVDAAIDNWGEQLALWTTNGTKHAFIAPMPEMNYAPGGVPAFDYAGDPANFILAFRRMHDRFEQAFVNAGVSPDAISWVFAPNSTGGAPEHDFENYYPGDDYVDVVGFSFYNFGGCPLDFPGWLDYDDFVPFLDRMAVMAPTKPIFITQTGTVDIGLGQAGQNKNTWLEETLSQLAQYPGLRGIMYFHYDQDNLSPTPGCYDWRFLDTETPSTFDFPGLRDGLADPNFVHWPAGFDPKSLALEIFSDGFESGDTTRWSLTTP